MVDDLTARKLDRRRFVRNMALPAALAALPSPGVGKDLRATAINHVSYQSSDYRKTRNFYVDLLGFQASDEDANQLYLWAGNALISAKNTPGAKTPVIDHCGFTVEPWDLNSVEAALKERALSVRVSRNDPHDASGRSAFTRDPNGYNVQLCATDLETRPAPAASRAPLKAIGIHHVSYQCPDYKRTRDFYNRLLGAPISKDDGRQAYLWFGDAFMVVANSADRSITPVIDRVAWTISDWDPGRVSAELKRFGLEARPDDAGKSVLTRDINGYLLQLWSQDLEKRPTSNISHF